MQTSMKTLTADELLLGLDSENTDKMLCESLQSGPMETPLLNFSAPKCLFYAAHLGKE